MNLYVLDTNTISYFVRDHRAVVARMTSMPMESLAVSALTEGELLYGLEKKPTATRLNKGITELLRRMTVLPWDRVAAKRYGVLRAAMERRGKGLGDLDLLIAAHAMSVAGILVTADKAFRNVPGLNVENWAQML